MGSHPLLQDIRAVVLDAVGTVIHAEPPAPLVYAEVGRRFASRLTFPLIAQRFTAAYEQEKVVDREQGYRTSEAREVERWRRIVTRVLDDVNDADACFGELFEYFSRPQAWRCVPGTAAILERLARQGYTLGMASNYDRRLRPVVRGLPELRTIQHLVISSEVGWRKPAPQFFSALCRTLGLVAERVLFVGDDPTSDYEGARAAGLRAVLIDPRAKEFTTAPVIRSLSDLQRLR